MSKHFEATDPFGTKIVMAETTHVERLQKNVDKVLWAIAPHMGWEDLSCVLVTDMSSLSDFGLTSKQESEIANKLGLSIEHGDRLYEIAMRMEKPS